MKGKEKPKAKSSWSESTLKACKALHSLRFAGEAGDFYSSVKAQETSLRTFLRDKIELDGSVLDLQSIVNEEKFEELTGKMLTSYSDKDVATLYCSQ